jgi:two-component system, OmpR family, response regulator
MRLLVVEDNAALAAQLRAALADAGFAVDAAPDGEEALFLGETEPYDAVVLDLGLPRLDGLTVLRRWRAGGHAMPVLILTARGSWTEKVEGLNAGADDYLAKPFAMAELIARLNALIRRAHGHAQPEIACGPLSIDTVTQTASLAGAPVRLTAMEFRLLECLAHHLGQPVSKTHLTEHLYGQDFDRDSNTLEVIVGRLRRKLGEAFIETVRGLGYKLAPPP